MPSITVVAPLAAGAIYLSAFVPAGRAEPVRPAQVAAGTPTPTPVPTMTFNNGGNNPGGNNTFQGPVIQGFGNQVTTIQRPLTAEDIQQLQQLLSLVVDKRTEAAERLATDIKARQDAENSKEKRHMARVAAAAQTAANKAATDLAETTEMGLGADEIVAEVQKCEYSPLTKTAHVVAYAQWNGRHDPWGAEPRSTAISLDVKEKQDGSFTASKPRFYAQNDKLLELNNARLKVDLFYALLNGLSKSPSDTPAPPARYSPKAVLPAALRAPSYYRP